MTQKSQLEWILAAVVPAVMGGCNPVLPQHRVETHVLTAAEIATSGVELPASTPPVAAPELPIHYNLTPVVYKGQDNTSVFLAEDALHNPQTRLYLFNRVVEANDAYFTANPKDPRKKDWLAHNKLIDPILEQERADQVVLRVTAEGLFIGVDGYGLIKKQKQPHPRLKNGVLDAAELVPNYAVPVTRNDQGVVAPTTANYAFPAIAQRERIAQDKAPWVLDVLDYKPLGGN